MYMASRALLDAVKSSHQAIACADVLDPFMHSRHTLEIVDGSFTVDYNATVRRQATLSVYDESGTLIPKVASDLLSPFTTRIQGFRGIQLPPGSPYPTPPDGAELLPQGVFKIAKLALAEQSSGSTGSGGGIGNSGQGASGSGGRLLALTLLDVSSQAQQNLADPVGIDGGTPVEQAIIILLRTVLPTMQFRFPTTGFTCPPLLITEVKNVWTEAQNLAISIGMDIMLDRNGVCILAPRMGAASTAFVWEFTEDENATSWSMNRALSSDMLPNVVVVVSTNSATPGVKGVAADMDPASPTYRYGPYGQNVETIKSDRITSSDQAQRAAQGLLARKLGTAEQVTFDAIPNPALDVGDTVVLTRRSMGLYGQRMIVSKITMPFLAFNPMNVTCQRSLFTREEDALALAGALTSFAPAALSNVPVVVST